MNLELNITLVGGSVTYTYPYHMLYTKPGILLDLCLTQSNPSRVAHIIQYIHVCIYMVYSQQNGPIKVSHTPCCNTTSMQSQPGTVEIGPGAVEAHPGSVDAHLGAVEPRPEFVKLTSFKGTVPRDFSP
jgi:hypothetical protein